MHGAHAAIVAIFDWAVFIIRTRQEQGAGKAQPRSAAEVGTTRGQSVVRLRATEDVHVVLCRTYIDMADTRVVSLPSRQDSPLDWSS